MMRLHDPIAGDLVFENFWQRKDRLMIFGSEYLVTVRFQGEATECLDEGQRRAFAAFDRHREELLIAAEEAIVHYYQQVLPEYRDMFGEEADAKAPIISSVSELAAIVKPTHLWFPWSFDPSARVVGLLCECSWEPGVGLGVKFINEAVSEVGTQDIVL
jgi:hypothetical protein